MAPLIVLMLVTLLAQLAGRLGASTLREWDASTRIGLAAMFCLTGSAHFNDLRGDIVAMVPPGFNDPELLVTLTGVCELLGAVGLLLPPSRRVAAGFLMVYLIVVLPANIYAAQAGLTLGGSPVTPVGPRIALQVLFIALLGWAGVRPRDQWR